MKKTILITVSLYAFCFSAWAPFVPGIVKKTGSNNPAASEPAVDSGEKGKTLEFPDLIQTVPGTIGDDDRNALVALQRLVESQRQVIDAQKAEIARLTQELKTCQENP